MKPLFPFAWPRRGSPARLPAMLVPVLGALALVQFALPQDDAPLARSAVARLALPPVPQSPPLLALPPALAQRALFASGTAAGAKGGATGPAADPLGGIRLAGTVRVGQTMRALVQWPDGRISYAGVGSRLGTWNLVALTASTARLSGPSGSLTVTFGSRTPPPSPVSEDQQ